MKPTLIGYFPRRPWNRAEDRRHLPPQVEDICNVGGLSANGPPDWINLWLHNDFWVYSTEARAWAAAVDNANLHRLSSELPRRRVSIPRAVAMDQYIARHVPPPDSRPLSAGQRFDWQLYAYRMFPLRFADGAEAPYPLRADEVQPLPADYVQLGLDVINRECDTEFSYSPLDCNGWCDRVPVNRYCLLDQFETARQLARHWSKGEYRADGIYIGPAEPGPYFIVEVLRKRLKASQ